MIMHHHRCEHGKHTSRVGTPHNSGSRRSPRGISPCLGLATWHLAHKTGQRQSQAAGSGIRLMTNKMAWDEGMALCVACYCVACFWQCIAGPGRVGEGEGIALHVIASHRI